MNISKNMLLIAALFTMNALDAKGGKKTPAQQQPVPGKQPGAQQPAAKKVTYKSIKDEILQATNVISNGKFTQNFLDEKIMNNLAQLGNYPDDLPGFFLLMARDKHLPLSNNDADNLKKLSSINQQIKEILQAHKNR